jgi:hypothetical protein
MKDDFCSSSDERYDVNRFPRLMGIRVSFSHERRATSTFSSRGTLFFTQNIIFVQLFMTHDIHIHP